MIQQQPEQRIRSVTKIKEELMGRGSNFVNLQRLDSLKTQVVPELEVSDPLIADPIHAVEKLDYRNGVLTLRLNRPVNTKWEECFRLRAFSFSVNVSSAMMSFSDDRVLIRVNDHFVPQAVEFFKQYCAAANEEYAARVRQELHKEIERKRAELKHRIAQEEARIKILERVNL